MGSPIKSILLSTNPFFHSYIHLLSLHIHIRILLQCFHDWLLRTYSPPPQYIFRQCSGSPKKKKNRYVGIGPPTFAGASTGGLCQPNISVHRGELKEERESCFGELGPIIPEKPVCSD